MSLRDRINQNNFDPALFKEDQEHERQRMVKQISTHIMQAISGMEL
jgi:hypothetical protein